MKEIYEKVWIKSADDLPKWGESYSIRMNNGEFYESMQYNQAQNKGWWLTNVKWYYKPIEPVEQKSAEEIKEQYASINKRTCEGYQHEQIIQAMEEYASQFKQPVEQLTDERLRTELEQFMIWKNIFIDESDYSVVIPTVEYILDQYMEYLSNKQ